MFILFSGQRKPVGGEREREKKTKTKKKRKGNDHGTVQERRPWKLSDAWFSTLPGWFYHPGKQ